MVFTTGHRSAVGTHSYAETFRPGSVAARTAIPTQVVSDAIARAKPDKLRL